MTSATLFREGPDLDELLAELDAEHGGRVHVTDVEYGRDGGVMGFFAKRTVGVHYTLTDGASTDGVELPDAFEPRPAGFDNPLEAMLRAAEDAEIASVGRAEAMVASGRLDEAGDEPAGDNVEFARMLLDIAAQKAAERQSYEQPVQQPVQLVQQPVQPVRFEPATVSVPDVSVPDVSVPDVPVAPVRRPVSAGDFAAAMSPAEVAPASAPVAAPVSAPVAGPVTEPTRAELLARARTRPVGAHRASDEHAAPVAAPVATAVAAPVVAPIDIAVTPAAPARTPLTLRRQLTEIGVPLTWLDTAAGSAFEVIEQLTRQVPDVGRPELDPGQLLVVAGPAARARAEAERLCALLRLDPASIRTAGCGADPIRNRRQAASLELDVRGTRGEPCIVVVATDSSGDTGGVSDLAWAVDIVAALAPDQLVLVVDATSRVADIRRTATALGHVTALAVVGAARAAGPAAMWELDLPVLSLDGAPASRGRWAALLIDRLAELDGA